MALLAQLVPTAPRVKPDPLDQPVLLVLVAALVTAVRSDLLDLLASLGLLVQMASPVPRERWVRVDRRERPVPLDPRDPLEPPDLMDLLVFLDSREPVVLRDLPVLPVSPEPQDELELLAPTVTPVPPAPLVPPVKTAPRVSVETPVPREDRETLDSGEPLVPQERRESPARMDFLVQMGLTDPRVWLEPVVWLVCLVSVEREASLDSLDLLVSLVSRDLLVALETVGPPDLWDPLA